MKSKALLLSILLTVAYSHLFAQWSGNTTNPNVSTNVGIGLSGAPGTPLDVNGMARFRYTGSTTAGIYISGGSVGLRGWSANNPYIDWTNEGGVRQGYMGWNTNRLSLVLENNYNFTVENGRMGVGGVGSDANSPRTWLHAFGTRVTGPSDTNEEQLLMLSRQGVYGTSQQEVNLGVFLSKYSTANANSFSRAEFRLSDQGTAGNAWGETLLQGHTVMTLLGNGSLGVRTRLPLATVDIAGNRGSTDERNFRVTNTSLTGTELSGLTHLQTELGIGWTALYAKKGSSAQYAGVFNGPVYVTGPMAVGYSSATGAPPTGTLKLAVDGKIGAREVNVTVSAWNDYVFAADYKLPTLDDVRSFIKANHHLPEVPSEKEVKENGIDVGEMNAVLLKKIEELTLYVLDQNDKIKSLEKTVNELTSKSKN